MSENQTPQEALQPTPGAEQDQDNSAQEQEAQTGGAESEQDGSQANEKKFSQEDLDKIVQKRVAKAEAKAEQRILRTLERILPAQQQAAPQHTPQGQDTGKPSREQYASDADFVDALTDWKLLQRDMSEVGRHVQQEHAQILSKTEQLYAQAEKLPGFDRDAFDELPLSKPMVAALIDSDAPAKLMHYMASHPDEVERIARLSPARQAAELGKLETKLPTVRGPKAPSPINPIGGGNASTGKDAANMSMEEYTAMRMKQRPVWAR